MMKKLTAILLSATTLTFFSCGGSTPAGNDNETTDSAIYDEDYTEDEDTDEDYTSPTAKKSLKENATELLRKALESARESMPMESGYGITMTNVEIKGNYVMYTAECDEDLVDMDLLNESKSSVKQEIINSFSESDDSTLAYFIKICLKAHKGIGYTYVGDTSGKECLVKIPYAELSEL